jgi:hypothetical protein
MNRRVALSTRTPEQAPNGTTLLPVTLISARHVNCARTAETDFVRNAHELGQ